MATRLSAREKVLVEGQHDWVKIWEVHRHVAEEDLSVTLAEVQRKTVDLIRSLIREGLAEVGDLRDHGARFEPWTTTSEESIERLRDDYVKRFDDRAGWPWTLWLRITEEGKRVASTHQAAYRRWLAELREQGREDEALPQKFEPQA
ncbi:hypothetical protein [Mycolicibacterium vaccae]|uniref:Uncharacterized protein n=1 Tax=Mycolicibacterium vaccae ATCC 25954 TaxID=1194972 RepID=K0UYH7_MYCVA|nr:hypothetical protein [Mycolicibacterium vaccae]EJZ12192.1 hypothetical protein MVAC_03011 [Mycolicibacterium vaccae ATCC 25954]MCV7060936.1 hypothetical protein [Mycolicibacterium vaccae]